jgi:hypothetical protein
LPTKGSAPFIEAHRLVAHVVGDGAGDPRDMVNAVGRPVAGHVGGALIASGAFWHYQMLRITEQEFKAQQALSR